MESKRRHWNVILIKINNLTQDALTCDVHWQTSRTFSFYCQLSLTASGTRLCSYASLPLTLFGELSHFSTHLPQGRLSDAALCCYRAPGSEGRRIKHMPTPALHREQTRHLCGGKHCKLMSRITGHLSDNVLWRSTKKTRNHLRNKASHSVYR